MNTDTFTIISGRLDEQLAAIMPRLEKEPEIPEFAYLDKAVKTFVVSTDEEKRQQMPNLYLCVLYYLAHYQMDRPILNLVHELHVTLHFIKDLQHQPGAVRLLTDRLMNAYTNYLKIVELREVIPPKYHGIEVELYEEVNKVADDFIKTIFW
ncbi:hypothetical protein BNJ_00263 [Kaumoebavirus]|uniref:hypothetical protein n=1 Tax=Kaumoebavirus TaxID=1859492 RepID=UPI0009C39AA5|nr:hypothetical protein BNJ_00263 [Kaumoebavirus]ARA72088.1 hypothetical protein BNJ_00263 [Kaumoebavirus]